MKKALVLLLFFLSNLAAAQEIQNFYFGLGVNASYAPLRGFNDVLNHYQNVRFLQPASANLEGEYFINNLPDINVLLGPDVSFGYMFKPSFNFEFRYMDRRNSRTSQVVNTSNSIVKRNFDFKSRTFGFGISRLFVTGKTDYIVGSTFNMTQVIVNGTNIRDPEPINEYQLGGTVFLKYIFNFSETSPFAIVINPYFQYHFTPIDYTRFNKAANPVTASDLSSSALKGGRSYFGLELQLNYFVFTKFNTEEI